MVFSNEQNFQFLWSSVLSDFLLLFYGLGFFGCSLRNLFLPQECKDILLCFLLEVWKCSFTFAFQSMSNFKLIFCICCEIAAKFSTYRYPMIPQWFMEKTFFHHWTALITLLKTNYEDIFLNSNSDLLICLSLWQ